MLLPVGFVAGIATDDVHPDVLLGDLYQPFVSVAVGVILFEAGLRLSFREVPARVRRVVARLIAAGVVVTWLGVALTVALLFDDVDRGVALLIGAILVVSGPTVVLPMLAFIRPPPAAEQTAARAAGLDADRGRMMIDSVNREVELEEITDAVLLTRSDDFNAVAATELRGELGHGHVYRVAPDPDAPDLLPPSGEPGILGDRSLTFAELDRRVAAGARIVSRPAADGALHGNEGADLPLFVVGADGHLSAAVDGRDPLVRPGDTVIGLTDAEGGSG